MSRLSAHSHKDGHDGRDDRLNWAQEFVRIQGGEMIAWRSVDAYMVRRSPLTERTAEDLTNCIGPQMGAAPRSRIPLVELITVLEWPAPVVRSVRLPSKSIQLGFARRASTSARRFKTAWVWLRAPSEKGEFSFSVALEGND
jgi:hypothetical protein